LVLRLLGLRYLFLFRKVIDMVGEMLLVYVVNVYKVFYGIEVFKGIDFDVVM